MVVRLAGTFTSSLARLTSQEQEAAQTMPFDLQMDPSSAGLPFHKFGYAPGKSFRVCG
jgi:hypothetical protein